MTFGFPLGLLTLAGLVPLTAAYFLRRRQKPVKVSALFLWRTPHSTAEAGPRFERYTREMSFLLEVLALLAATAFIADLRLSHDAPQKSLVILVDGSLSMSARPPGGLSIAERVRRAAAQAAHDEGASALTVVESGARPRVLAGPRAPVSQGLAALDAWKPLGAAHSLGPSLSLARDLAGPKQRFYFFTDGLPDPGQALLDEVEWRALGVALDNVAFVAAQRRDDSEGGHVTVRVTNFGRATVHTRVSFRASPASPAGKPAAKEEDIELAPRESRALRVSFTGAGAVAVSLPDDALPDDGHLTLLPSFGRTLGVRTLEGLGSSEARALERFVAAEPELKPGGTQLTVGPPGVRADVSLGAKGSLHSYLGPFFSEKGDPLLEDVDLAGVVWTAGDSPPGRWLVSVNDIALVSQEGASIHINCDVGRSSLTRTEAWPILLGNVIRRARSQVPGLTHHHVLLGDAIPVVTEPGAVFTLSGPGGEGAVMGNGSVLVSAPTVPGHYVLKRDGKEVDALEVLPIDAAESDLTGRASGEVRAKADAPPALAALTRNRPPWPVVILLVLGMADFALTARRRP